jgi:hypothetical protein
MYNQVPYKDLFPSPLNIGGETALRISLDVSLGTPVVASKVRYGPKEIAFRKGIEDRWAAHLAAHPGAIMDFKE